MSSLFKGTKPAAPVDKIETVIGASANFSGHLQADGGIRIDGTIEGTIETAGNVFVGEGAKVLADTIARNISVAGAVKGNINATGRLEILASGRVWGDITVASLTIEEGGMFRGQSIMQSEGEPLLIEPPKARPAGAQRRPEPETVIEVTPGE